MIIGLWHLGSGLGDQLFCYLAARITAVRLSVPFGMAGEFKGSSFIRLDRGVDVPYESSVELPAGKIVVKVPWPLYEGKTYYDPEFNFIEDNTIVDGCRLQDERYWQTAPISQWLQTDPLTVPDDLCVINFRGGEYAIIPELFLPKDYWERAIAKMRAINPHMRFEVHTDDPMLARTLFPEFEVIDTKQIAHSQHTNMDLNWRSVRYARYAILSNSAFGILPRCMKHRESPSAVTIAPRYWAGHNKKEWQTPQNYYSAFTYL